MPTSRPSQTQTSRQLQADLDRATRHVAKLRDEVRHLRKRIKSLESALLRLLQSAPDD